MTQQSMLVGALFVALFWGVASILEKRVLRTVTPETLLLMVAGLFFAFVAILASVRRDRVDFSVVDGRAVAHVVGIVVVGFLAAYYTLFRLMRSHDVHRVIGLAYVTPAITLALAFIFLGEKITAWSVAGILLMMTGVLFLVQST